MSTAIAQQLNATFIANATICAILPVEDGEQDHRVCQRTYGPVIVNYPKEGEAYKLSRVTWKKDFADVGDYDPAYQRRTGIERRKEFVFDAKQIADDVCKEINSNGPGVDSFFGVFVCAGNEPTAEELESGLRRLEKYFSQCITAADAQWSNNPRHDLISGVAKRAARYLKLDSADHEWMSSFQKTNECPVCGSRVKPGVAVCLGCGAILNEEKAAQFGFLSKEEAKNVVAPKKRTRKPKQEQKEPDGF